jgi:hypothetical protein
MSTRRREIIRRDDDGVLHLKVPGCGPDGGVEIFRVVNLSDDTGYSVSMLDDNYTPAPSWRR